MGNVIGRETERVAATLAKHLDDLIGNARWFTTIVIAEVAGLSKVAATATHWKLAVVVLAVVGLAFSVLFLILSIYLAQSRKNKVQAAAAEVLVELAEVDLNEASSNAIRESLNALKAVLKGTGDDTEEQARLDVGLGLFFAGSVLAGLGLFLR